MIVKLVMLENAQHRLVNRPGDVAGVQIGVVGQQLESKHISKKNREIAI